MKRQKIQAEAASMVETESSDVTDAKTLEMVTTSLVTRRERDRTGGDGRPLKSASPSLRSSKPCREAGEEQLEAMQPIALNRNARRCAKSNSQNDTHVRGLRRA